MFRHLLLMVLLGWAASAMAQDCDRPGASLDLPDAQTATEEDMVAASQDVRQFVSNGQAYVDCLQPEIDAAGQAVQQANDSGNEEAHVAASRDYLALLRQSDSMIEEMKALAGEFNGALRAYNARVAK